MHSRRWVPAAAIGGAFLGLVAAAAAEPPLARGFVYHDANSNGVRDPGEPGVPDVRVSNGCEIVRTDADGAWQLPAGDDTIFFVIKPRDWRTPIDELNIPRFYYIHKPAGSPPLKYGGVTPTGPLPASLDFALYPEQEPARFQVLIFGDTQPGSIENIDHLAHDIVEPLMGTDAAFTLVLGDIVSNKLDLHEPVMRTLAHLGVPVRYVMGNHDSDYSAPTDAHTADVYQRKFGPAYHAFDYGPVHFIVLDDIEFTTSPVDADKYRASLGERQLAFVRNDLTLLPKDQLVVLSMHIPIVQVKERAELYKLLAEHPHTVSFSAHLHYHQHWFLGAADGWPGATPHHHTAFVTTCGSWWTGEPDEVGLPHTTMRDGAPNGWCVATFEGATYSYEFRAARRPADYQMNIHAPNVVAADAVTETEVLVNVFAGSERSTVELRVGNGPWAKLERVEREDPYYVATRAAQQAYAQPQGGKLPKPVKSSHLWRGTLPADLAVGTHQIEVRTTDVFGQTYAARRLIRVE